MKLASRCLRASRMISTHPSLLGRRSYLFLLSHIRGYTTVFSHILGSHPEISGYAETWISYRTVVDLYKLRFTVCNQGNFKPGARYFLDKILHNRLSISPATLQRNDIQYLFMIREPVATLKSMLALRRKYEMEGRPIKICPIPATVSDAVSHYAERLTMLADIGTQLRQLGKRALVIQAEDLIADPKPVLSCLQKFLSLHSPLDEHYSVFDRTGTWHWGDPSEFIRKGKIERKRSEHAEVSFPDSLVEQANCAYSRCLSALQQSFPASCHLSPKETDAANLQPRS